MYGWMLRLRKEEPELFERPNTGQWIEVTRDEAALDSPWFFGSEGACGLEGFKKWVDLIVANRLGNVLAGFEGKVFTWDLIGRDWRLGLSWVAGPSALLWV